MTAFGIPMNQAAIIFGLIATLCIYFFPVIFSGEQEGFVKALNERFSNREQLRKRLAITTRFLKSQKYVASVDIWNPDLANDELDWVERSLIPALFDARLSMVYHIRIDERSILENFIHGIVGKELIWEEEPIEHLDEEVSTPIDYEYLETWEKSMLAVYVFASTASLSQDWLALQGAEDDGFLNDVISLRLVKILIARFKERLFSEKDLRRLISPELFASRCLNDYGILSPALRYNNDVWALKNEIVQLELEKVDREMRFMTTFLQTEIDELIELVDDPVATIKINSTLEYNSIYNRDRLTAIRFFVTVTSSEEQYKIFKQYWHLIIQNPTTKEDSNEEIYRIIGIEFLLKLTTIFERAAMYNHAVRALNYVETVLPFKGKLGKARIKEREGNFEAAITSMLEIRYDLEAGKIKLSKESIIDLYLEIAWVAVSGRLEKYRSIGWKACDDAGKLLTTKFDTIRDSNRTFRLLNVLANYEEWEERPEAALDNYNQALEIPGLHQTKLSNLFVNRGIALRQIKQLEESVDDIEKGVEMKAAIGDADQLPIALHNLALTCLELAFTKTDPSTQKEHFTKGLQQTQIGLAIQQQTGSTKRRGQLLAEKFVCEHGLARLDKANDYNPSESLEQVQNWLKLEAEAGRGDSYECKTVINKVLGYVDNFQAATIEEAIDWKLEEQGNGGTLNS